MEGRQVARKVRLKDIAHGKYIKVEGEWKPNYVEAPGGFNFSRANVIATIASEPIPDATYNSFVIDDGTARVPVRIFEEMKLDATLGDVVLIIGRPREYNSQIYLVPEIIKKIEKKKDKWIQFRRLELGEETDDEEGAVVEEEPKEMNDVDSVIELIKKLDSGDGADTEEVIAESNAEDCEKIISNLLREGEIFEISSGKLKVLE